MHKRQKITLHPDVAARCSATKKRIINRPLQARGYVDIKARESNPKNLSERIPRIKFSHFILTRFNIHLREHLTDPITRWFGQSEDKWMNFRLDLFEVSLVASLKNQTSKDFIWLCLFDSRTAEKHRQRISQIASTMDFFIPLYVPVKNKKCSLWDPAFTELSKKMVYDLSKKDSDFIAQTRIDSDNYIDRNFCKYIHEYIKFSSIEERQAITFPWGYYLTLRNRQFVLWKRRYLENACATVVERYGKSCLGIWASNHSRMHELFKRVYIEPNNKPMWVTPVQHGFNHQDAFNTNYSWRLEKSYIPCKIDEHINILSDDLSCDLEIFRNILNVHNDNK